MTCFFRFLKGENTILIPTFSGYGQFGPYILVAINLVHVISTCSQFGLYYQLTNGKCLRG